jgi:tetrahydromethanopterin:alpha-L-glutamate ligase
MVSRHLTSHLSPGQPAIAIITDDPGWHGRELNKAFAVRGYQSRMVSLTECRFEFVGGKPEIMIPGFAPHVPQGVFVRGVPGGTLEQVILRLDLLHALQACGIPVYNDARAIERSVDKAMTTFLLCRAGIPTPETWVVEDPFEARSLVARETKSGKALVAKPLFGSQGKGLIRLHASEELPPPFDYQGVYYLQRYVEPGPEGWHDWRLMVIGGRLDSAMIRRGSQWINNVAQGARCERGSPDETLAQLALDAVRAVNMDYAGVDIICDKDGRPMVLEVNSIPAWKGLQGVTGHSIAQRLADDFLRRYLSHPLRAAQ